MIIPYDLRYQPFTIRTIMFACHLVSRGHAIRIFHRPLPKRKRGSKPIHQQLPASIPVEPLKLFSKSSWNSLRRSAAWADLIHFQKMRPATTVAAFLAARLHRNPLHQDWDDDETAFCWETLQDAFAPSGASLGKRLKLAIKGIGGLFVIAPLEWLVPKLVETMGGASMWLRRKSLRFGTPLDALFPARVGVDLHKFGPGLRDEGLREKLGLDGPTFLYSGHLGGTADLFFFADILETFSREAPAGKCLVIGGGTGRSELKALLRVRGLEGCVVMTQGFIPHHEMPRHIASCDLAAVPLADTPLNRSKSSLTLLECMASGLPVVTSDVGDMGWMLGEGGEIAKTGDPVDFGKKLAGLARDPKRRRELGQKARNRVSNWLTWERSVDFLEAAYQRALAKRSGGGRAVRESNPGGLEGERREPEGARRERTSS